MSVVTDLRTRHSAVIAELAGIAAIAKSESRSITPQETAHSRELLSDLDALEARLKAETAIDAQQTMLAEARVRAGLTGSTSDARVTSENMVYGPNSEASYYRDLITLDHGYGDPRFGAALQRRAEWGSQVEREVADGSDFGRRAEKQIRGTVLRDLKVPEHEARAIVREVRDRGRVASYDKGGSPGMEGRTGISSGGGATASASGGAASFISPVFGTPYIPYREYGRAFADQCATGDMPDYGLAIYKPQITGPAGVGNDTDANIATNGVTEVDPTAGYEVASLTIFEGQVTLTQAVIDRMAPDYRFDAMCEDQLHRDYDPKFDVYALTRALSGATSQSWTGNSNAFELVAHTLPGSGGFYGAVSQAKANMRKLVGTVLNATHLFMDPALYEFIAAWADAQGHPVMVPNYAGPFNALANSGDGDAGVEGATGTRFNGLNVFTDANIPTTNGTLAYYQAIVGCLNEVETYESAPVNRVLPQTNATKLQVILQRYSYAAVFVNYAAAVTAINGTGFTSASLAYTG
jgi:hypothetical protein